MTDDSRSAVWSALAATLAVQALASLASLTIPVLAPTAAAELGLDSNLVGLFASLVYVGAMTASMISGGLIARYGAIRLSQISLVICAASLAVATVGPLPVLAVSALALGLGYGPPTPASSQILARHSPPRLLSLVFSIKQTGVPLGGMMAGALVPPLVIAFGWRGAAWAVAGLVVAGAFLIAPVRRRFDGDREERTAAPRGGLLAPVRLVLSDRRLRPLVLTSFTFSAMQQTYMVFLVTYLVGTMSMTLVKAGLTLSVAQIAGIVGRIVWGALADALGNGRIVLTGLAVSMSLGAALTAGFSADWPFALILVVSAFVGATAIGWNGVYLAEVARLAPEGEAGQATGGALAVTFSGVVTAPPLFGLLASAIGTYDVGYVALAALTGTSAVALMLLIRGDRQEKS